LLTVRKRTTKKGNERDASNLWGKESQWQTLETGRGKSERKSCPGGKVCMKKDEEKKVNSCQARIWIEKGVLLGLGVVRKGEERMPGPV